MKDRLPETVQPVCKSRFYDMSFEKSSKDVVEKKAGRSNKEDRGSVASKDTTSSAQRFYEMDFEPNVEGPKSKAVSTAESGQEDDEASQGSVELNDAAVGKNVVHAKGNHPDYNEDEEERTSVASRDTTTSAERFYEMNFENSKSEVPAITNVDDNASARDSTSSMQR